MLRIVSAALRGTARTASSLSAQSSKCRISSTFIKPDVPVAGFQSQTRYASSFCFTSLNRKNEGCNRYNTLLSPPTSSIILSPEVPVAKVPVRTLTKFSLRKGKRKSVKTVLRRFYRLNWGMWIRTKAGRHRRMWRKTINRKRRSRRHVMTTASQSWLLDTMVTKFWRRRKYYVDDPYEPYHSREHFNITRKQPRE